MAIVCSECPRKVSREPPERLAVQASPQSPLNVCFASAGVFCMGMVTRGGCRAVCTAAGLPCWGCRGPAAAALRRIAAGESFDEVLAVAFARRSRTDSGTVRQLLREVRTSWNSALDYIAISPEHPGRIT